MPDLGLVTTSLERELFEEIQTRGIVFWLDKDSHYSDYVDTLVERHAQADFKFPVVAFRGSFLKIMLDLEEYGNGTDPSKVLIHMPGFNEEQMKDTPLLELYRPGYRFRKALDTLIRETATGRVSQEDIDDFLKAKKLSLRDAEDWLSRTINTAGDGLLGYLENTRTEDVIDGLLIKDKFPYADFDGSSQKDCDVLYTYLNRKVGMNEEWVKFIARQGDEIPYKLLQESLAAWLMCVEYVHDLTHEPYLDELKKLTKLNKTIITECRKRVSYLRQHAPSKYEEWATNVEENHLADELPHIRPENLGKIDTFRAEEARILQGAVEALANGEWKKVEEWARARDGEKSFWLSRDQQRRFAWNLVADAAKLGDLLSKFPNPFNDIGDFEGALEQYANVGSAIDQAHRHFEQQNQSLLHVELPHFSELKSISGMLRRRYREWADTMARDFSALCEQKGMLPESDLQQRTLFDQVVKPLVDGKSKVAVFMIDAMRYEMAAELRDELKTEHATNAVLKARFAELPTVTSVGMNALAPVACDGRLILKGKGNFRGFSNGEFTVARPEQRAKAMGIATSGEHAILLKLKNVCDYAESTLKRKIAQKQLIVVHSREIDDAGEAGLGVSNFSDTLGQIRAAWHHLRTVGVKHVVFTSDHGFLLQDATTKICPYGKKTDPSRRHIFSAELRKEKEILTTSLSELGYQGSEGYLLFRQDTAVFDTGTKGATFVHGGNSPQERIIPVLTVSSSISRNLDLSRFELEVKRQSDVLGHSRVLLRVQLAKGSTAALGIVARDPVDLGLKVPDRDDIKIGIREVSGAGRSHSGRLKVPVGDPWTEVFFSVEGPDDERVKVQVYHPDWVEKIEPKVVQGWFDVLGTKEAGQKDPSIPQPAPEEWMDSLTDIGVRKVFLHLNSHGSITELEATKMLGSARRFRRFSIRFEEYLELTPLRVRIEQIADGKRYVKEGRNE